MFYYAAHGQKIIKGWIKLDKQLLIIDLDGTFVSVNTFHKWMKFIFIEELKRLHFISVFKILKIVGLRFTKSINHAQMKFAILELSEQNITTTQIDAFVNTLDTYVNHTILEQLQKKCGTSILATAAPLLYAKQIKEKYYFDYVIATPSTKVSPWKENIKDEKSKNVSILLESQHLSYQTSILYTDHHDDTPLIRYTQKTYLINPSIETKDKLEDENISFTVLM